MKRYFIYHSRWQFSAAVMYPIMMWLEQQGLPLWANLMTGQAFGAIIFYQIDKLIFKERTNKHKE